MTEPAARLSCCKPVSVPFPSGIAVAHSRYCGSRRRGQKLDALELAELRRRPPLPRTLTPQEADELEPVGELALRSWLAHPDGCACAACAYVDAHTDGGTEP